MAVWNRVASGRLVVFLMAAGLAGSRGSLPASPGMAADGCGDPVACPLWQGSFDPKTCFGPILGDEPWLSCLKNQQHGDLTWNAGGELRYRFMNERNRLRPPGPGHSTYDLWRVTPYVQANYAGVVGGYVQAIDASMFGLDAPYTKTPIDVNRADLLQYYGELTIPELGDGRLSYRYGRQFLQYGGQRLLSSLAWANTFRNFEGHKLIYSGGDWTADAFSMLSVNGAAGSPLHPFSFDPPDQSRRISGVYSTWKGLEHNSLDLYYLWFDEQESSPALMDGSRHTLGSRLAGNLPVKDGKATVGSWNWDVEAAWQFGEDNFGSAAFRDVQAGMAGALGGYTWESLPWKPGVGGIFYWGSGDNDPTTGDIHTFFTMYPLGHAYWGQIDNFSGENLLDYGAQFSLKPHNKLNVVTQWHYFELPQPSDRIYNIVGTALPGSGDAHVGSELDVVATWTASPSFNVQLGWLYFFYGDAVNDGTLARADAEQLYLQATVTF
jgi:hypothetical protein